MVEGDFPEPLAADAIRQHYDELSPYYWALWGEHIHHGLWEGDVSSQAAQVKLVERLALRAGVRRGSHVLDVGCGLGGSTRWLARHLDCSVLGITLSPTQAQMAERITAEEGLSERARFRVMDASDLERLAGRFDAVWVVECSEHLTEKERFLHDCARLLNPDGRLALCAWVAAEAPAPEQVRLLQQICRGMLCPSLASLGEYRRWSGEAGLEELHAEELGTRVRATWDRCSALVERPWVRGLLRLTDARTREFVAAFPLMQRAFADGTLGYGMLTARKPG